MTDSIHTRKPKAGRALLPGRSYSHRSLRKCQTLRRSDVTANLPPGLRRYANEAEALIEVYRAYMAAHDGLVAESTALRVCP